MPATAARQSDRRTPAFTLVELLVATTIGGVLMIATASVAGSFSQSVAVLMEDVAPAHETALARMARDVRYAWWADVPSPSRLVVDDHLGRRTEYRLVGTDIIARHPDGEEGVLCEEVAALNLTAITMQRLREGPQVQESATIAAAVPAYADMQSIVLGNGASQAVGFVIDSSVGERSVAAVNEQVVGVTIGSISLPLARGTGRGQVTIEIFPARALEDGRRRGGATALGSISLPLSAFAPATHRYPGDPGRVFGLLNDFYGVTLELAGSRGMLLPLVSGADLASVVGNIDLLAVEAGFDATAADRHGETTAFIPSSAQVNLNAAGAFPTLVPGVAYTLMVTVTGSGSLLVLTSDRATASAATVAARDNATSTLVLEDYQMAFAITGARLVTSTLATDEVGVVRMELQTVDGQHVTRAAGVFSQVLAEDPWLGVVQGDAPPGP